MPSSKGYPYLLLFLFICAVGSGTGAYYLYNQYTRLSAQLLGPDERADLNKRIAIYEKQIKGLQNQLAALRGRTRHGDSGDDAAAAIDDDAKPSGDRRGKKGDSAAFQVVRNSPEFQKLQALQMKAELNRTYAALFKNLNLSPQQLSQLQDLLVQKQQATQDAYQAARDQGLNPRTDPTDFNAALQAAQASVNAQIQQTLGDSAYAQYQQYVQTLPEHNVVTQLTQSLSYTATPLSDDEANQLVQALAQAQPQSQNTGYNRRTVLDGGGIAQVNSQAITLAQSLLSAPQLQALQQIQAQQQAQQQVQQLTRAAIQSGAAAPR